MSQNTEYIEYLVFKFNSGNITPDELQVLTDWYNSHDDERVKIPLEADGSADGVKSRILAGLLVKVEEEEAVRPVRRSINSWWMSAAAAILVVALGTWIALDHKAPEKAPVHVQTSIEPGGNKATLTLANGRTIALSSAQAGIVTGEAITYADGTLVENAALQQGDAAQPMVLHTPRGGTYTITLPDGTQIWLNAASTIKYPSRFAADQRIVELEGEAYFQVKPAYRKSGEKIPFRVVSKQQEVEVLGTQFNMSAYPEQASGKTTLVEGKVAISDKQSRFILAPNEQAVTTTGKTQVRKINAAHYTAWREGKFSFDGKTFGETMSEIGRWYDLNIVYENGVPNEELVGDAFRNQNIDFVLRLLNVAEIDYKLDIAQRKLTIKGKR